jgi:hypothetical protein
MFALATVACVQKPTMHLNHAEITGAQLTFPPSVQMVVVMDVYNPNSYDVAVRAVRGQAVMADVYPLAVDFRAPPEGVWMPAGQTTQLRVPLLMPVALGITLLQQAWNNPTINYRFIGKADVTGTRTLQIEKDDYSVDERGTITRDQIAAILPNSFAPPPPSPPLVPPAR